MTYFLLFLTGCLKLEAPKLGILLFILASTKLYIFIFSTETLET